MTRRLPPLSSLRAFEAAARHLSFKRAAEELSVTPAAVSQQIRTLEETLGVRLFRRLPRAILLTDAGQRALPHMTTGFDALARGVAEARRAGRQGPITVSVAPSVGGRWLVPRLGHFAEAHPGIDVRVEASEALTDFETDGVDLAIRFGRGDYAGLRSVPLMADVAVPLCAPALTAGPHALRVPDDLAHHTLLHLSRNMGSSATPNWGMWLKAAGVEGVDPEAGTRFSDLSMLISAAVAGQGVALGPRALVSEELSLGRLVVPFCGETDIGAFSYFLVMPEDRAADPRVAAFADWVIAEAAAMESAA